MWYNAGTVSVTNNSATVTGAGTAFADNVDAGQSFVGPDGLAYEILSVISATQITISPNYRGATAAGQAYRIMPVQGYLRDLANQAAQLVLSFATVRDGVGQGKFPDGLVGTPGIRFASDEDTGFWRPGANSLSASVGGAEGWRLTSSGLAVTGVVSSGNLLMQGDGTNAYIRPTNAGSKLYLGSAGTGDRIVIHEGGNVGIGVGAPGDKLTVGGSFRVQSGNALIHDGQLQFFTSGARKAYLYPPSNGFAVGSDSGHLLLGAASGYITPFGDNGANLGNPSIRWSVVYAVTGVINTSDERAKQEISPVPDEWLDAWGELEWVRYKFRDAVETKGDGRWHVGLIAQHVRNAFAARGLDGTEIGLLCYDEWDEEREPIMEERQIDTEIVVVDRVDTGLFDAQGNPVFRDVTEERPIMGMVDTGETRVTLEAGNRWGLRYDECQAMEAAWQRRELARLRQEADGQIAAAEAEIAALKQSEIELRVAQDARIADMIARITALEGGAS